MVYYTLLCVSPPVIPFLFHQKGSFQKLVCRLHEFTKNRTYSKGHEKPQN